MTEVSRWETHRGDEWWYSDSSLEASAVFNEAPPALVIDELHFRNSGPTAALFYSFLWQSHQQFPDAQIRLILTESTHFLIESLANSGRICFELVKNPYSLEARISFATSAA